MSRHGQKMNSGTPGILVCPESGLKYREDQAGNLTCLDISESDPLPTEMAIGQTPYRDIQNQAKKARLFAG